MLPDTKPVVYNSTTFRRTLLVQTAAARRTRRQGKKAGADEKGRHMHMLVRLHHGEKQHDFYAQLHWQYSTDLLKLVFYVRKLLANPKVEAYLQANHAEVLTRCRQVVGEIG